MVEDPVQHHLHAHAVGGLEHAREGRVAAEGRVHVHVVAGVVLVVAAAGEDRVEVEGVDAQLLEVGELLGHPVQVAAHEVVEGRRGAPGRDPLGIVGAIAVGEALGEDLVEDGVLGPVGGPGKGLGAHALVLGPGAREGGEAAPRQQNRSCEQGLPEPLAHASLPRNTILSVT
ncbi:hypothetical protein D3C87_1506680 [compost metagenome]